MCQRTFYRDALWMIRFLEDPFIVAPFCCGVSVHAIRSDKMPVLYALSAPHIDHKMAYTIKFQAKTA